ncbi:MAG: fimbria/pilus outer membrane usher protein [Pseudomonadota bacterium]|nr:fimbria/pilus outer membrane usher protein [Pseudomonadota bacterium]
MSFPECRHLATLSVFALLSCLSVPARGETLWLETLVNGYTTRTVVAYRQQDNALDIDREDLEKLGLKPGPESAAADGGTISLADIPNLAYAVDGPSQTIDLQVPWQQVDPKIISVLQTTDSPVAEPVSGWGSVLSYDVFAEYQDVDGPDDGETAGGFGNARLFAPWGVANTSFFGQAGNGESSLTRLESTAVFDRQENLTTWRLGDFVTGSAQWSRPVRLGGIQWSRNRDLRPDLVPYPVPSLSGEVTVPSTLDVFVDGALRYSQESEPGPFVIDDLPVITGRGEASVVLRDALGRETVATMPFYVSTSLLQQGLTDYGLDAGFIRREYGIESSNYGSWGATASLRHGLMDTVTLEGHAETAGDLVMAGGGAYVQVGTLGVVNASGAWSTMEGGDTGTMVSAGFEHRSATLTVGGQLTLTQGQFADMAL